jgi:hypothetical protein
MGFKDLERVRFDVFAAMNKSMLVLWVVTPCGLVNRYQLSEKTLVTTPKSKWHYDPEDQYGCLNSVLGEWVIKRGLWPPHSINIIPCIICVGSFKRQSLLNLTTPRRNLRKHSALNVQYKDITTVCDSVSV